uniref:Major facilitator superfamily (MFS) profile domain-containing protein n=1 Tax=Chenopodium quinoa TaxID=63459 RepID=A0A803KP94_CHEQI
MVPIGAALGSIVCGKLTDYLGRRHVLQLTNLLLIFGWSVISLSQGPRLLDLGRWMLGFTSSISGFAVPVYVAEFTPKDLRGGFVILHVLMLTVGISATYLIGLVISWRTLALIGIIPSLVQIVGLFFIPESPRWLLMMNKNKEFEAALQCFRGGFVDVSQEADDIRDSARALHQMEKVSIIQLFQRKFAYAHTVGIGLAILSSFVGLNGIIFYASSIFESAGFSAKVGTTILAFCQLPSMALAIISMDKFGSRPLMMISATGLFLGCSLTGLAFLFQEHQLLGGFSPFIALIGILTYVALYPIGVGGGSAVIISEYSLFGSMVPIGGALGSVVCGKLTDYLGRKHVLQLTSVVYIFGWSAISVSQGARLLDLGRLMLGVTSGITGYAIPVYIAEFTPKDLRGGFVILHVLMITVGVSTAFLIGQVTSWCTLSLIGIIPGLVQIVGLFFIPESPRWLTDDDEQKQGVRSIVVVS